MTPAPFGLLLDVDGPIASPLTRTIAIPSIAEDLARMANRGIPVVFNTGRSDAFIREVVLPPMRQAGLDSDAAVFAVCEKGASWFRVPAAGDPVVEVDESLSAPKGFSRAVESLVQQRYAETMFFDHTKRSMVSVEHFSEIASARYLSELQPQLLADAQELLDEQGLAELFRLDPSIISVDMEHRRVGKDLGAERAVQLLRESGVVPQRWFTAGDSRVDYDMARWLHGNGYQVEHLDVRPADGIPEVDFPVLTHPELIHDEAMAPFLSEWAALHPRSR